MDKAKYNVLSSKVKKVIYDVYKYFKEEKKLGNTKIPVTNCIERVQDLFKISQSTLSRIVKKCKNGHEPRRKCAKRKEKFDSFQKDVIKRALYGFYERNETVTSKRLKILLEKKHDIVISKSTLVKMIKSLGFKYKKRSGNREVICERSDLVRARANYLHSIKAFREDGYTIVYTDETWVNACHTAPLQWNPPDPKNARNIPTGRGRRLIVLHAGCAEKGFLDGCDLVFEAKSRDNRDYHTEMNGEVFLNWLQYQLLPALPPKSVVVMDNAPYHSMLAVESRCPTSGTRKRDMQIRLEDMNIDFDPSMKKPELYDVIKANKPLPKYQVDERIRAAGHEVLRLPPYHCNFNPIELIWADLKNTIGLDNNTFKLDEVKKMVYDGFSRITRERWNNCVRHVVDVEEPRYWRSDGLTPISRVVINLQSDDDDDC